MKPFFTAFCLFILSCLSAQPEKAIRSYNLDSTVTVQRDLVYNNNEKIPSKQRQLDVYEPSKDSSSKHPLIVWMHGGGFKYGTKNAAEIKLWGNEFAKRGYVVAAINYRRSKKHPLLKFKDLISACYDAVDDVQTAVNYLKANADKFNIDTSKIILGGNSAGAIIALQAVYSNRADLRNVIDSNKTIANTGNYNPMNIAAVINFWGALLDKEWLSRAKVPIVSVCGSKDKLVPPDTKRAAFFGSVAIHKKADALHIPNRIKVYEGYGHELQKLFNPFIRSGATKKRWIEAADFAAQFLEETAAK